jgi:bifunctional non-homologous end joining protein LigD
MRLLRVSGPLDDPEFIFEPKFDAFLALTYLRGHHREVVSRMVMCSSRGRTCVGRARTRFGRTARCSTGICCLEPDGRSHFRKLLFRREWEYAFDVLSVNGTDLRALPLLARKRRLRGIMPKIESRLLYLDHLPERGHDLYRAACERDLEGVVAKWAHGDVPNGRARNELAQIKNSNYSRFKACDEFAAPLIIGDHPQRGTRRIGRKELLPVRGKSDRATRAPGSGIGCCCDPR